MRALIVSNFYDADPGFVGERLRRHGYAFTECHRERSAGWPELAGHDLVLLLGSDWSVYWPHVASEVAAEAALICAAHGAGVPVLGICYGSQISAHALGGAVRRASEPEIGWYRIESALPTVIAPGPWFQWHSDVVDVPPGAEVLAQSAVGPQAWRIGRTMCTQFHPEVTESIVRRWIDGGGAEEAVSNGCDPADLLDETRRSVADSRPRADVLVDWFLDQVAGS